MNRPELKNILVIYSDRNSLTPEMIQSNDIVIFLAGPTPSYPVAKISWRDLFAKSLDDSINANVIGNRKILLINPEPSMRNWIYGPSDQIDWEHHWLERSDIILFWHETRWTPNQQTLLNCYHGPNIANIGIQFRFEVGMYIADHRKIRIFYVPNHAQGTAGVEWWIKNKPENPPFLSIQRDEKQTVKSVVEAIHYLVD